MPAQEMTFVYKLENKKEEGILAFTFVDLFDICILLHFIDPAESMA